MVEGSPWRGARTRGIRSKANAEPGRAVRRRHARSLACRASAWIAARKARALRVILACPTTTPSSHPPGRRCVVASPWRPCAHCVWPPARQAEGCPAGNLRSRHFSHESPHGNENGHRQSTGPRADSFRQGNICFGLGPPPVHEVSVVREVTARERVRRGSGLCATHAPQVLMFAMPGGTIAVRFAPHDRRFAAPRVDPSNVAGGTEAAPGTFAPCRPSPAETLNPMKESP